VTVWFEVFEITGVIVDPVLLEEAIAFKARKTEQLGKVVP